MLIRLLLPAGAVAQPTYYVTHLPDSIHLPRPLRPLYRGALVLRLQRGQTQIAELRRQHREAEATAIAEQYTQQNQLLMNALRAQITFAPVFVCDAADSQRILTGKSSNSFLTPLYPADSVRPVRPGHFLWIDADHSLPILTLTNPLTIDANPGREGLRKHSVKIGRFSGLTQPVANRAIK